MNELCRVCGEDEAEIEADGLCIWCFRMRQGMLQSAFHWGLTFIALTLTAIIAVLIVKFS